MSITDSVNWSIHPKDEMYLSGKEWYFRVGESGLKAIHGVVGLSRIIEVKEILDLPCGYGRIARFLRASYPDANITFCDIESDAVDFCSSEFDGNSLYSSPDLCDLEFPNKFDLIWVGSLFTHVDYARTERWIKYLCGALSPDGVLVATFHGAWALEFQKKHPMIDNDLWQKILNGYRNDGYGYASYRNRGMKDYGISLARPSKITAIVKKLMGVRLPSNAEMGMEDYGISLARPSKITAIVEKLRGVRLLSYTERGWANNHDVLGVAKRDRLFP